MALVRSDNASYRRALRRELVRPYKRTSKRLRKKQDRYLRYAKGYGVV